jgi:transposase-like protein
MPAIHAATAKSPTHPKVTRRSRSVPLFCVRLRDSLANPPAPLSRLFQALERGDGPDKPHASASTKDALVAQTGAEDAALVRLAAGENRKLTPEEIAEVAARYQAGASIRSLGKEFGMHEQTVRAHLRRRGVTLRLQRPLTDSQEDEVARLYVEESLTIAELVMRFNVGKTGIRNALVRKGVVRRPSARRPQNEGRRS